MPLAGAPHLHFALRSANGRLRRELSFTCPRRKPLNYGHGKETSDKREGFNILLLKKSKTIMTKCDQSIIMVVET